MQLEQIDIAQQVFAQLSGLSSRTLTAADVRAHLRAAGAIASVMGMEGGHAIENSLGALRAFYDLACAT